jgi:hypothetical protein
MAKVLFEGKWYEELAPKGVYETVYEGMVKAHASTLWPRFHGVHFKANVYAGAEGVAADFALVERGYTEWWIVEVEMEHHNFESHIAPQTRKLAQAKYAEPEAIKLCEGCPKLDLEKTKRMLEDLPPRVLVVLNKPRPDWVKPLAKYGAIVAVFEIFQSEENKRLFRVNGEHPLGPTEAITLCHQDNLMRRWLLVETPASLNTTPGQRLTIIYRDHLTEWESFSDSGKTWLFPPKGPNPLSESFDFEIIRRGDGQLMFKEIPKITGS